MLRTVMTVSSKPRYTARLQAYASFAGMTPFASAARTLHSFGMASNPKPKQPFWNFNCERAILKTHPDRPVLANPLEMQ